MLLYISSKSTLKALGYIDTEAGLCIMARAALEKRGGGAEARAGWGDCQDEGGRLRIGVVHVHVLERGMGRCVSIGVVHLSVEGGWLVVGDQPNYTWLIQSNRSGPM